MNNKIDYDFDLYDDEYEPPSEIKSETAIRSGFTILSMNKNESELEELKKQTIESLIANGHDPAAFILEVENREKNQDALARALFGRR